MTPPDERADAPIAWLTRELRGHMRKHPKRHQLADAACHAHGVFEANVARTVTTDLACAAGCGGCCAAHVGVEMAEAFAIRRHVEELCAPHEARRVLDRVADVADRTAGMDPASRWAAQIFCAFLEPDEQKCSIYSVRPLACRGYTSTDLEACMKSARTGDADVAIPGDAERMVRALQLRRALGRATAAALDVAEEPESIELHAAVTAAEGGEVAWSRAMRKR